MRAATSTDPVFGSVFQTHSDGISRLTRGQIRESNQVFYLDVGRSDGSTLSLNSRDHAYHVVGPQTNSITGRVVTVAPFLDWSSNSFTLGYAGVDYDPNDFGDWMAAGYWLHATGDWRNGQIDGIEVGAIADGPEFSGSNNLPNSSTATYQGRAAGLYAGRYGSDPGLAVPSGSIEVGEYSGDFRATANFQTLAVTGSITNIYADGYIVYPDGREVIDSGDSDIEVSLSGKIESDGRITGSVLPSSPSLTITTSSGSWGSQLSSTSDASGNPRAMAGTHGGRAVSSGGTEVVFIGAHYGTTGRFE